VTELDFRRDGAAALEWAAQYLERVPELPVLAQVHPGELSAKLPASAPEQPEAFADVQKGTKTVQAALTELKPQLQSLLVECGYHS